MRAVRVRSRCPLRSLPVLEAALALAVLVGVAEAAAVGAAVGGVRALVEEPAAAVRPADAVAGAGDEVRPVAGTGKQAAAAGAEGLGSHARECNGVGRTERARAG